MFMLCVVPDKFVRVFLFFVLLWGFIEFGTKNKKNKHCSLRLTTKAKVNSIKAHLNKIKFEKVFLDPVQLCLSTYYMIFTSFLISSGEN